jgi:hypothetical protein
MRTTATRFGPRCCDDAFDLDLRSPRSGTPRYYISSDLFGVYEHHSYQLIDYFEGGTLSLRLMENRISLSVLIRTIRSCILRTVHRREGRPEEEVEFGSSAVDVQKARR